MYFHSFIFTFVPARLCPLVNILFGTCMFGFNCADTRQCCILRIFNLGSLCSLMIRNENWIDSGTGTNPSFVEQELGYWKNALFLCQLCRWSVRIDWLAHPAFFSPWPIDLNFASPLPSIRIASVYILPVWSPLVQGHWRYRGPQESLGEQVESSGQTVGSSSL